MCPVGVLMTAFCGISTVSGRCAEMNSTRTYMPGSRFVPGFGITARRLIVPVFGSTRDSVKSSLPS